MDGVERIGLRDLNNPHKFISTLILIYVLSPVAFFAVVQAQGEPGIGGYEKGSLKVELITMFELTEEILRDPDHVYIQQTGDGGFIIGGRARVSHVPDETDEDYYIVKYSSEGKMEWSSNFGLVSEYYGRTEYTDEFLESLQQTSDGGYILVGVTDYPDELSYQIYVVKVDEKGNEKWSKILGGRGDYTKYQHHPYSVQETSDGGYIIAGYKYEWEVGYSVYLIKIDKNGDEEWSKTLGQGGAMCVQQTSDGGYIVAGYTGQIDNFDIYVAKTDRGGDIHWVRTFGGKASEQAYSVQETSDGGYIVAGYTWSFGVGDTDVYLIKIDINGNMEWSWTFGSEKMDWADLVKQTRDGGYIVVGTTEERNGTERDGYVIKTDKNGRMEWGRAVGVPSVHENSMRYLLSETSDGGYIFALYILEPYLPPSIYIAKYKPVAPTTPSTTISTTSPPPSETTSGNFKISSLSIKPTVAEEGEQVRISVVVTNMGGVEGTYTLVLKINGETRSTRDVTLKAGESSTVSWVTSPSLTAGTYNVEVNGLTGSFTIIERSETTETDLRISIYASPSYLTVGESTLIRGSALTTEGRAKVTIQYRWEGGPWNTLTQVSTNPDGSYSYSWTPGEPGTYELRALLESGGRYDAYISETIRVNVEEPSSPCIIMTAAYGSPLYEEVSFVRHVRDDLIGSTWIGRQLVDSWNTFYYVWSPSLAKAIASSETAKALTRAILAPLIYSMYPISIQYQYLARIDAELAAITAFITAATIAINMYITLPALTIMKITKIVRKKTASNHS